MGIKDISMEYPVDQGRVDICLKNGQNAPMVFIEVKNIDKDLEKYEEQLLDYSFRGGVMITVLTNGIKWWFYLPTNTGHWQERKVCSVDLLKQETGDIYNVMHDLLNKDNVLSGNAKKNAKEKLTDEKNNKIIKSKLPETWKKLLKEPNEDLIKILNDENEKVCGRRAPNNVIKDFLIKQVVASVNPIEERSVVRNTYSGDWNKWKKRTENSRPISFTFNGKKVMVRTLERYIN